MNAKTPKDTSIDALLRNIERIHADIQFADRKAAVVIAAASALLAVVQQMLDKQLIAPLWWTIIGAIASLLLTLIFGFLVIMPRGHINSARGRGLVDGIRIAKYDADQTFLDDIAKAEGIRFIQELHELARDYSQNHSLKYSRLKSSVYLLAGAAALSVVAILWHRLQ